MQYDPSNPLSDNEMEELMSKDENAFFEYLDSQAAYLKNKNAGASNSGWHAKIVKTMSDKGYI